MLIQDNEIVDLSKVKRLSQDHLNTHLKYHNKEINPIMYGDKFPYGNSIQDKLSILGDQGKFSVFLDSSTNQHEISDYALSLILDDMS